MKEEIYNQLIAILSKHAGETGENEDAIETLKRLSNFWNEHPQPFKPRSIWPYPYDTILINKKSKV